MRQNKRATPQILKRTFIREIVSQTIGLMHQNR